MEEHDDGIRIVVADASHVKYVNAIQQLIKTASLVRDSGIANRSFDFLATKMKERKAVIALYNEELAGFCYIECWENKHYVCHSGLVVAPRFRGRHLATRIKQLIFSLTRLRWPEAVIYGLTNSSAVMHINTALGYVPVPFGELPKDEVFWKSCGTAENPKCINCDVLESSERKYCVCTAMRYDPTRHPDTPLPATVPQDWIQFIENAEDEKGV